jgi:hypothetical protein
VRNPAPEEMPIRTRRPDMTPARALLVKLMEQYVGLAYRLTLLEVQKLAYFLQEAGEPFRLRYEPGHYGPSAADRCGGAAALARGSSIARRSRIP